MEIITQNQTFAYIIIFALANCCFYLAARCGTEDALEKAEIEIITSEADL